MGKKLLIWNMLIIIFIASIVLGYFVAKNIGLSKIIKENEEATLIEEKEKNGNIDENMTKIVNYEEEKIGPNTKVVLRKKYKLCGHIVEDEEIDKKQFINLTKEELKEKYKSYSIKEFSKSNVILEKEIDDICDEHFFITEEKGVIVIYKEYMKIESEDKNMMINKKKYITTDIAIDLLPEEDIKALKRGKEIIGKDELNKFLEDYE